MSDRAILLLKRGTYALLLIGIVLGVVATLLTFSHPSPAAPDWKFPTLQAIEHRLFVAFIGFMTLAALCGITLFILHHLRIRKTLRQRARQLENLALANLRINENLEVPAVLRSLIEAALQLTGSSDGAAGQIKNGQMVFTEYFKSGTWIPIDFSFPPGYGVPGWVIEQKRPYISNDTRNDPVVIQEIREQLGFYNLADTPIFNYQGELVGCFEIHNTIDRRPFDEHDVVILKGLAASAAVAIDNARILAAQKKSEELLRASERKYRSLFENSPVSLWEEDFSAVKVFLDDIRCQGVTDLEQFFKANPEAAARCAGMVRVVDVNQATVDLFSARSKNALLTNLSLVFTDASIKPFTEGLLAMASSRHQNFQATGVNRTLSGEEIDVSIRASIMPGYEETWEKVLISMTDVTQEREIDRLKNEFISTAAHELRTPLTVIMGYSDLLIEHLETTDFSLDQKKDFLGSITLKVGALERIIEDLLDVSKIESGRPLLLEKAPTRISGLFTELVRNHQRETRRHRITSEFDGLDFLMLVDAGRLTQVLDNLLTNAIKYSPDGGEITVTARRGPEKLEVSVSDHGLGMTREQTERVFDKFYRADTSNTARAGLGLGMSIVKSIVEAHDGRVWVESTPGQGTTVRFTLPLLTNFNGYFTQEIPGTRQIH